MEDPTIIAEQHCLMSIVEQIMECELKNRHRAIIRYRFGLDDGIIRTQEETGREYSICRERVRVIEQQGLAKLRKALQTQGWTGTMINQLFD